VEAVRSATTVLDPPPITNVIAIAAPVGGWGRYAWPEIELAFSTAFTGFRAALVESFRLRGDGSRAVVHTGFWGCGVFGGDRVLMAIVQILAAKAAGVFGLRFHTVDAQGTQALEEARGRLEGERRMDAESLPQRLEAMGFEWGVSDNN